MELTQHRPGYSSAELLERYKFLIGEKSSKKDLMRQINDFFIPDDKILSGTSSIGDTTSGLLKGELLDTTGSDLIDEFVSFVLGLQFITDNRWFSIKTNEFDETSDVNRILNARADVLYKEIARSNYHSALPSLERDCIVHGHGMFEIEPSESYFAKCTTHDNTELALLQDSFGDTEFMAWPTIYPAFQLLNKFPSLYLNAKYKNMLESEPGKKYSLLTIYYKTPNHLKVLDEYANIKYIKAYAVYEGERLASNLDTSTVLDIFETETFEEENHFATRDASVRNTPYGSGIGRKALPKARITNKLMFNLLKLAGLQANPPRVQHQRLTAEGNNIGELQEGQVITASSFDVDGAKPQDLVNLLQVSGDLNSLIVLYQLQQTMLANLLPTASSIYKTARQSISEIQGRLEEQEKRLAPLRVNFLREGPSKHLQYFYKIAEKQGKFNREDLRLPEGVEIKKLDFVVDAFLLSAYKQGKALRAAQALGIVANFLSLMPSGVDKFNIDKIIEVGFDGFNVLDLLDSREATAQKREIQQQRLQQQQLLQQQQAIAATDASNAKILDIVTQLGQNAT